MTKIKPDIRFYFLFVTFIASLSELEAESRECVCQIPVQSGVDSETQQKPATRTDEAKSGRVSLLPKYMYYIHYFDTHYQLLTILHLVKCH